MSNQKFSCHYCDKVFTRRDGLIGHLRVHTGERPHQCQMCGKRFSDSSSLTKHIRTHTGEKPFLCNLCNRAFSISHNLTRHLKLHFKDHQNDSSTVKTSDIKGNENLKAKMSCVCSQCGEVCESFPKLNRHLQKIHKYQPKPNKIISPTKTNSLTKSSKIVISDLSSVSNLSKNKQVEYFTDFQSLRHEKVSFKEKLIDLCGEDFPPISEKKKTLLVMPNNENLNLNNSFSGKINLDQNILASSDLEDNHSYNQRQSLLTKEIQNTAKTRLFKTIPSNVSNSSNSVSFFSTSNENNLFPSKVNNDTLSIEESREINRVKNPFKNFHHNKKTAYTLKTGNNGKIKSSNKKRISSLLCQYNKVISLLRKGKISHHAKTLLEENVQKTVKENTENQQRKKKSVFLSEMKTTLSANIQEQQTLHHLHQQKLFSGPPSIGQDRTKTFTIKILQPLPKKSRRDLTEVVRKKYPCLFCDKVFTRPGGLVGHTRVHTGEKPYKCQICGKRFSDSSSLTKHIRTHTGEKPFQCKFCHRAFSISHNLTRHIKLHSRDKLHSKGIKLFTQTLPTKESLLIDSNSRTLERRINKFHLLPNCKLRKKTPDLTTTEIKITGTFDGQAESSVSSANDSHILRENSFRSVVDNLNYNNIKRSPISFSDKDLSKENVENDIKQILTNISSVQIKEGDSQANQDCVLTECPPEEKENLEKAVSVPLVSFGYDSVKNFGGRNEPNETLKDSLSLNNLDVAIPAHSSSNCNQSVVSENIRNNFEIKVEQSWFDMNESINNEKIESERIFLTSNQCEKLDSVATVTADNCVNSYIESLFKTDVSKLPLLEQNKQQATLNGSIPPKPSQVYRCGYCPKEFQNINLLSEHIQIHNKKSQFQFERKSSEEKIDSTEIKFSESFKEAHILKKKIGLNIGNKNTQNYGRPERTKLTLNSQPEIMHKVNIETQQMESIKTSFGLPFSNPAILSNVSSVKISKNLTQNYNLSSLQSNQIKSASTKNLLNELKSKFQCMYCSKIFNRHAGLIGHLRVHTGEKPYECQICNKRFSDSSSLTKHIRTHTGEKPFTCTICCRAFSISHNLTRHLKLHVREKQQSVRKSKSERGDRFVHCRYCWATFQSLRVLKSHLRYHSFLNQTIKAGRKHLTGNGKRKMSVAHNPVLKKAETLVVKNGEIPVISVEDDNSPSFSNRQKQLSSVHRIQNKILKNKFFNMSDSGSLRRKTIKKGKNFKTFPKSTLWCSLSSTTGMDVANSEGKKNEVVPGSLSAKRKTSDIATLSGNNTSRCQKEFLPAFSEQLKQSSTISTSNNESEFVLHSTEINPTSDESKSRIMLKSCYTNNNNAELTTDWELRIPNQILKDVVTEKKTFSSIDQHNEVDINENVSNQLSSNYSRSHDREIESISMPPASVESKCGYGHKSFKDFTSLSKHVPMHKEQQGRSAKRNSNIGNPLHSWSSNEKFKTLRFKSEQIKPLMSLNNNDIRMYTCPFCIKQFNRHSGLIGHIRVHTGEKPHECQTCQKRFSDSSSLTKHIRTHTGEKPFHCKFCHRAFSISHNLTRHLRLHLKDSQKVHPKMQQIKKKNDTCNQKVNINKALDKNKIASFGAFSNYDVSYLSSVNLEASYCKVAPDWLENQSQSCINKNNIIDHHIHKISKSVSSSEATVSNIRLTSNHKFNEHKKYSNPEKISSHMKLSSQSILGITTDHIKSLSHSNHNVSSNPLLDDQEISLEYKPQFLSSFNHKSSITNKNSFLSDIPSSDAVIQIIQPVTINYLQPVCHETSNFSSGEKVDTSLYTSSNENAVESLNIQNSPISPNENLSENKTNTFSEMFSKKFLLLNSLSNYSPSETNDLHLNPSLHKENLQSNQISNSYTGNPNLNTTILTSFSNEFNMKENKLDIFSNKISPSRTLFNKKDNIISVETGSSGVTELLAGEKDPTLSVDKKTLNPFYAAENSQTLHNTAKNLMHISNQNTFTSNLLPSFQGPGRKTLIHKNTCILCRTFFPNNQQLEVHLKIHRAQNKTFTCDYCGHNFTRFSGLMGHARTHTLERPYVCTVCQRAFSDSSSLTKHTRRHTGEKPFTCKYCSRAFSISHNLTRHLKLHLRDKNKLL